MDFMKEITVKLSLCTPWWYKGELRYGTTCSQPQQQMAVRGQPHTPTTLSPGKEPLVLGSWVSPSAGLDILKKRKSLASAEIEPHYCPVYSLVPMLTTPHWLHVDYTNTWAPEIHVITHGWLKHAYCTYGNI